MSDYVSDGRRLLRLNIIDEFSFECLAIEVGTSISGQQVGRVLDSVAVERGFLKTITTDHGTEFASRALFSRACERCVEVNFITPVKPNETALIEVFTGRLRDE